MFWHARSSVAMLIFLSALPIGAQSSAAKAFPCRQVHGRAAFYNGGSTLRVWAVGTHHMFWIQDDTPAAGMTEELIKDFDHQMFADFELCSTQPFVPGHMQKARLKAFNHARVTLRP